MLNNNYNIKSKSILKFVDGSSFADEDFISIEEPLEIKIIQHKGSHTINKTLSITMRTPGKDEDLITGFLFTESIVSKYTDIEDIELRYNCEDPETAQQTALVRLSPSCNFQFDTIERHFYTASSCGICGKTSIDLSLEKIPFIAKKNLPQINIKALMKFPELMRNHQSEFNKTGAIHACALFDLDGNIIHFAEDVGRHNALDKLIGKLFKEGQIPTTDGILLVSGRVSFELMQKAAAMGVSIVAAIGAPTSLAIELAENFGMTLVGFLKSNKANIYTKPERIILS